MFKNKIMRDTAVLTLMQLFLDTAALLLNVFITRQLGTSAIGILSLTGSFLGLAGILSNGNAFLCTSRLVSEELGKKNSNPNRVLLYGISFCLILSSAVSVILFFLADEIAGKFFSGADMTSAIRLMPAALVTGAAASCFKGYFNACRKSAAAAVGDIMEFAVKAAVIVFMTLSVKEPNEHKICGIMIAGIIAGNVFSLLYCLVVFIKIYGRYDGQCSLNFRKYVGIAFPIMGGSILTAALSSTNDALIPVCLRQYGNSVAAALSQFGIFEAIVIPTLFFPSVVLCSMSGIIVSESARAAAAGNSERIKSITARLTEWTLIYAVFAAAVLMRFGKQIGELLGGGELAGKMITVIAPVVPFIYLEIVLEGLIKGVGLQAFSSMNYLAEYAVRISSVLILVPKIGFYGIVASYYASNVIGNCARFIKIIRHTKIAFRPFRMIAVPVIYAFLTMGAVELMSGLFGGEVSELPEIVLFVLTWIAMYCGIFLFLHKDSVFNAEIDKDLCSMNKFQLNK